MKQTRFDIDSQTHVARIYLFNDRWIRERGFVEPKTKQSKLGGFS